MISVTDNGRVSGAKDFTNCRSLMQTGAKNKTKKIQSVSVLRAEMAKRTMIRLLWAYWKALVHSLQLWWAEMHLKMLNTSNLKADEQQQQAPISQEEESEETVRTGSQKTSSWSLEKHLLIYFLICPVLMKILFLKFPKQPVWHQQHWLLHATHSV